MQEHCKKFGKQAVAYMLSMVMVVTAFAYHPPKANAIAASVVLTTIGTTALVPFLSGFCSSLGEDVEDLAWSYLFDGTEDEYISDYVSGAGRSTITNSDTGISLPFYLSEDTITSYESLLNNGKLLSFEHGANELAYVLGEYSSSNYGTYRWSEPDVYFISPEFFVSESDAFTFTLNSFNGYGRSLYYSTWTYGVKIQKYIDGSWSDCAQFKPNNTTSFENVEYTTYVYEAKSGTVSLVGGYTYRVQLYFDGDDSRADTYAGMYGFHRGIELSGFSLVSTSNTTAVPASTRPSGLSTVINDYNTQNINTGGNYINYYIGTVDANGDVVDVYDFDIFDESTMTINNPASGDTWTATAWEYDYETRSYYCTLEDDQYVRITYGDDYVTIIYPDDEGTYHEQYYYYITAEYAADSSGSGTACDHVYTSETTTLPTCTESGWRTYTCELCGYSYKSSVPATGHIWEATETVDTEYNDNGDVTKLGYTVYTCTSCGETYTAYMQDGQPTEPPGSSSGGGIFSWLGEQFKKLVSAVVDGLASGLEYLVKNVIGAVTDWLLRVVNWLFDLFDGEALGSFFNWFSDGNEILNNEWASGSGSSGSSSSGSSSSSTVTEVDLWAYSLG